MKQNKIEIHDFYCLNCGKRSFSLPRKSCHQHKKFHRKKLYCPNCRITCNSIEIKTEEDRWNFLNDFENGVYDNERKEIIYYDEIIEDMKNKVEECKALL